MTCISAILDLEAPELTFSYSPPVLAAGAIREFRTLHEHSEEETPGEIPAGSIGRIILGVTDGVVPRVIVIDLRLDHPHDLWASEILPDRQGVNLVLRRRP